MKLLHLALRSLSHFRFYTWINVIGLTFSLTCVIIISRYVYSEWSTDHFNSKLDRLCLVTAEFPQNIPGVRLWDTTILPQKDAAIEKETTFYTSENTVMYNNHSYPVNVLGTDTTFLELIDYPVEAGNKHTLFRNPDGIAITHRLADLLFGKEDPIGKTITLSEGKQVTVEAIIGETSTKSSLSFDLMVSDQLGIKKSKPVSVLLLYPNTDLSALNNRWDKLIHTLDMSMDITGARVQFFPLKQLYFNDTLLKMNMFPQGNRRNIYILLVAAILILLVGLFNYINIYTLIQQKRNRELGIKKVFGSGVRHIIGQFFIENLVLIATALFFSWILVELTGKLLQMYFGLSQVVPPFFDLLLSVGVLFVLPLVVSVYPFFRYLSMPTVSSLRSSLLGGKASMIRPVFLVLQYVVSIVLIVVSLFFMKQLHYMLHADMGFRTEDVVKAHFITPELYKNFTGSREARKEDENKRLNQITQRMNQSPLFTRWQYANSPNNMGRFKAKLGRNGGDLTECIYLNITNSYLELYDIQLTEGRFWDGTEGNSLPVRAVVNEAAKRALGISDINNTLLNSEGLMSMSENGPVQNPSVQVIGVVKDFHIDHLSKAVPPIFFLYNEWGITHYAALAASVTPGKRQEAIRFLHELHNEAIGGDFSYTFVEDEISALYEEDKRVTTIYSIFALIAMFISAMGLFGLSLFDIQQRYKEIAIRKVNGATTSLIMKLLLNKYLKLLLIAFVIATPISWLAITKYVENFAFKAPISWWLFAIALLLTAGISLLTLIWQIRKAARINPAEAIKTE